VATSVATSSNPAPNVRVWERHITWLTLRHTAGLLMFAAGLTIFEVQHRLGHKSPTMTAEIYTHLMRERFNEGHTRLENYMNDQRQ
jgi:integrase